MPTIRTLAPIFAVSDIDAALAYYRRLGFEARAYAGGGYGFLGRDDAEIHLGWIRELDPSANTAAAYLFVVDADALAEEWRAAGAEVSGPVDTEWGQHEAAHVDPWGNVIRFGSPMPAQSS